VRVKCSYYCGEMFQKDSEELYWHIKIHNAKVEQANLELQGQAIVKERTLNEVSDDLMKR